MTPPAPRPGRGLGIPSVPNLRDLGDWPTPHGTVRRGVLFRSAEFSGLTGDDLAAFDRLGLATVYDFRTEAERVAQPNALPAHIAYVPLDVMADSTYRGPAMLREIVSDPKAVEELLGEGKAVGLFEDAYREIIDLPSAKAAYRRFFADLADGKHTPALFHCTTGKDRTGWAAAAILMLLGVSDDDVMADYLLTNEQLAPAVKPVIDQFVSHGGDGDLLATVLGVRREFLTAAIDQMRARYGDIDGYLTAGLGLDPAALDSLRSSLVVPAGR
jgi:protein-tyrosine phosphatase